MPSTAELPAPDFEIDHPDDYAQYFLSSPCEISFYLNLLAKRGSPVTVHIDDGRQLFLTTIVAVDEEKGTIFMDPAQTEAPNTSALLASRITLVANLDRVKVQLRLPALREAHLNGQRTLSANIPDTLLRLQRREFFRLEPPQNLPIGCQLAILAVDGKTTNIEPKVNDISGGGLSLTVPVTLIDACQPETLLHDCRLDLPGEGILLVNLRIRKMVEISTSTGAHNLRVGCEFVGLPGTRLAMIERYITRIERERKARDSGLAD